MMMLGKLVRPIEVLKIANSQPSLSLQENREPLRKVGAYHPRIFVEPIYYLQRIPHSLKSLYLREGAYERLIQAALLLPENYSLILYDGYRPLQVQQFLFTQFSKQIKSQNPNFTEQQILQETRKYVAFPSLGNEHLAPHLTGGAIDITLGDKNGKALDLGTAFDEISEKSATRYFEQHTAGNVEACKHRRILYNCMTMTGFTNYAEEWWHYDFHNIAWARRVDAQQASYGAIEAQIYDNQVKEYRYL
ncbi:M15 family metallopeptidase [Lysinibacillus sphaericus]|uniref:D-alanyl-D-alanine dipeptidase n=1 Tax=Lysinibacillus sphaericus OT4b.31 TaxID=1285586 RepID=R7Z9J1_LYSSH|nr:M15 family metallopeptidase [Lysinibacillus sphaericus]EON70830.1 D-alanyl-D-alanine dipeptidase [Lysinibacillus sphaericus OT4b.31]